MVASMAGFALEDMFIKAAAKSVDLGQILILFGLTGAAFFAIRARMAGDPLWHKDYVSRPLLLRSLSEVSGRLFYALAFVLTPLVTTTAILQATPLVVVAGAAILLGEPTGWRRWMAVGLGFLGVMIILRPGVDGFDVKSLLAVAGMLGFAGRDLATRAAPPHLSNRQLGLTGFAMLALAGVILTAASGHVDLPGPQASAQIAGATVFGIFAYNALTIAMRTGDVAAVTPFRYTRLLFALVLGVLVFDEQIDAPMVWGSFLIVGSGIFALLRGRKRHPTRA